MFICHSLGGIILKRVDLRSLFVQNLADTNQVSCDTRQLENVVNEVTAGIVFLGTPHLQSVDDIHWDNWKWILQTNRKDLPKECLSSSDIINLSETCQSFTRLNPPIPILSVHEGKVTKLHDNLLKVFRSGSNHKLVS